MRCLESDHAATVLHVRTNTPTWLLKTEKTAPATVGRIMFRGAVRTLVNSRKVFWYSVGGNV